MKAFQCLIRRRSAVTLVCLLLFTSLTFAQQASNVEWRIHSYAGGDNWNIGSASAIGDLKWQDLYNYGFDDTGRACYTYLGSDPWPTDPAAQVPGNRAWVTLHLYWTGMGRCAFNPAFYWDDIEYGMLVGVGFYAVNTQPLADAGCPNSCVGDPINPINGNVYSSEIDTTGRAPGESSFRRFYNSQDSNNIDMGIGWRHSYSRNIKVKYQQIPQQPYISPSPGTSSLYVDAASACTGGFAELKSQVSTWQNATATYANGVCSLSNGSTSIGTLTIKVSTPDQASPPSPTVVGADVTRDDGRVISFLMQGTSLVAPPGVSLRMQQTSGGYSIIDENDTIENYDSTGKLLSITSRGGVVQTLSYDGAGRLSNIVDSFGHSYTLTYDWKNRVATLADANQITTYYVYDTNHLTTVWNLDGTSKNYLYENSSFADVLTGAVDESSNRYSTWDYDSQARANGTHEAGGANAVSLVYHSDGSVTATDALGAVRTFTSGRYGDRNLVTGISGSKCPTCSEFKSTTYDLHGFLSSRTDYNDNVTIYVYDDSRGLETSRTEAYQTANARTITTSWHETYRLPATVSTYAGGTASGTPLQTTSFTYDGSGNQLTKTITDPATSGP